MGLHAYGNARASMSSTDPSTVSIFVNVAMLLGDLLVTAREFRRAKVSVLMSCHDCHVCRSVWLFIAQSYFSNAIEVLLSSGGAAAIANS